MKSMKMVNYSDFSISDSLVAKTAHEETSRCTMVIESKKNKVDAANFYN